MKYLSKIVMPGLLVYAVLLGLLCIYNDYSISALMPLAPIIYGLVFGLVYTRRRYAFNSIVVLMLFAIWFLRLVLIPCIYVMSGYVSNIQTSAGTDNLNMAVLLVGYEFITVGVFLVTSKKISIISNTTQMEGVNSSNKTKQFVRIMVIAIIMVAILCVLRNRSVLAAISSIFEKLAGTTESAIERRREFLWVRSNSRLVFQLFFNAVYYLQILIPASLITFVINKRNKVGSNTRGYFLCLLIAASSVLITTDNNIDSVCIMVACLLVIIISYRNTVAHKIPFLIGLVGLFILYFLFTKAGTFAATSGTNNSAGNALEGISATLCAYFSAIPNVSAGLAMRYSNKLSTLFGDIVAGIPYMAAFFRGYPTSVTIYNEVVHGYTGVVNQIVPLIISGYKFFGPFAPVLTVLTYCIALNMEIKMRKSHVVFNQVLFAVFVVNLAIGPCIFGFPNTIKRLCHFVPLIILANINERVTLNER